MAHKVVMKGKYEKLKKYTTMWDNGISIYETQI